MNPDVFFRRWILASANNQWVQKFMRKHGMRLGAARFVAGEALDQAVQVLRRLNELGFVTNTTILGEGVADRRAARAVVDQYLTVLDRIKEEGLRTNVALKLSHLGLDLGEDVACMNLRPIVARAGELGNFIRLDMEESWRVTATLRIYRQLRNEGFDNLGVALQAYLYRTEDDLRQLLPLVPNVRLVKGAYLEPPSIAFPKKADVDRNFIRLAEIALTGQAYTAIATHDERIIEWVKELARQHGVGNNRFEFQMLYGVRPQLQQKLVAERYRVLIAAPFGPDWYPYLMRRLAERPANLFFFVRSLVRR